MLELKSSNERRWNWLRSFLNMAGSLSVNGVGWRFAASDATVTARSSAVPQADEWLRDCHEDPEEDIDIKGGEMRCVGEVFQKAPDREDRESSAETPEHGLNEDG